MFQTSFFFAGRGVALTSFFSLTYLVIFLPVCLVGYSLAPKNWKKYVLLAISYGFFWLISGGLIVYLALSTLSMYGFGLWLDRLQSKMKESLTGLPKEGKKALKKKHTARQRRVVVLAAVFHIGLLLVLKYSAFFAENVNALFSHFGIAKQLSVHKFFLPIGISFFTLQALSYILDVYHGVVRADRNFFRLALFLSFFPAIVEGPICRYGQTAEKLWGVEGIHYQNLTRGLQRILYGMLKKIVIADRLNQFVNTIFTDYTEYEGGILAVAAVCYTVQLYMDFSGSMDAVCGTAQIFGIEMPENFNHPFFSKTISEFWTRWHITLGAWFRDYVFYPVTTAKPMKKLTNAGRKKLGNHYGPLLAGSVALFCVWFCNGLWHGAGWNYIFFGMYHFALILLGNVISPLVQWTNKKLSIKTEWRIYRSLQILRTTFLVIVGELFFKANDLKAGFAMLKKIVTQFTFSAWNEAFLKPLYMSYADFFVVAGTMLIVFVVSLMQERGISLRESLSKKHIALRWAVWYALILFIVIFGAYGLGYDLVDPLYAQF